MVRTLSQSFVFGGASISGEGLGYGFGPCSEKEAEELLKFSFELGVRYFDTAPIYGFGLSEERMGRYLPKEAKIITKGGVSWDHNQRVFVSNAPQTLKKMVEDSLQRLQRTIDIYLIHWPDDKTPIEASVEALLPYWERGDIGSIGLSNPREEDILRIRGQIPMNWFQFEGNYLVPESKERIEKIRELLSETKSHLEFQSWGTLKKGILSARVTLNRRFSPEDARSWAPWWKNLPLAELIEQSKPFLKKADETGVAPVWLAMAYNLEVLGFTQVIIGVRSKKDMRLVSDFFEVKKDWHSILQTLGPREHRL